MGRIRKSGIGDTSSYDRSQNSNCFLTYLERWRVILSHFLFEIFDIAGVVVGFPNVLWNPPQVSEPTGTKVTTYKIRLLRVEKIELQLMLFYNLPEKERKKKNFTHLAFYAIYVCVPGRHQ